jgi:hypothetical protein
MLTSEDTDKLGDVSDAVVAEARAAGLSEAGIEAMRAGDKAGYRRELRRLEVERRGSIWACTDGYKLLFDSMSPSERSRDEARLGNALSSVAAALGAKGGRVTSPAKARAARLNGQRGGRPSGS